MAMIPTAFNAERTELVELVKSQRCRDAELIAGSNSYEDLASVLDTYSGDFSCRPEYLKKILDIFSDATLISHDVHYDKLGTLVNPKFIVEGILDDIILDTSAPGVFIYAGTTADRILVRNGAKIDYLLVSSGSKINRIVIEDTASVKYLAIETCGMFDTEVTNVTEGCRIPGLNAYYLQPQTT